MKMKDENGFFLQILENLNLEEKEALYKFLRRLELKVKINLSLDRVYLPYENKEQDIVEFIINKLSLSPLMQSTLHEGFTSIDSPDDIKILLSLKNVLEINLKKKTSDNKTKVKKELTFHKNGKVVFVATSGKVYQAYFRLFSNPFRLLSFLTKNPQRLFSISQLIKIIKTPKENGENSLDERRIRDTIETIRKKIGLTNNSQDDFFKVESKHFGIDCDVNLKK